MLVFLTDTSYARGVLDPTHPILPIDLVEMILVVAGATCTQER
jgi:hypothetical protein